MNFKQSLRSALAACFWVLPVAVGVTACAQPSRGGTRNWSEEVLLHDGSKIIVERTAQRAGRHEIGQSPPIAEQSITFYLPGSHQQITWEDRFSPDIGSASFLPMLLDIKDGIVYLVVSPAGCLSYNKSGRPNPPYVIFKREGSKWVRIELQQLPAELNAPNLIFSSPDEEANRTGQGIVSAEKIKKLYQGYRQREFQSILREPLPSVGTSCGQMVSNGKGKWLGKGWFTRHRSYEGCNNQCFISEFDDAHCPCKSLFNQ